MDKLSPRQQAFADFYIELGNATEAAVKAGYSEKFAGQNADKLLKNTKVKSYIDNRMKSKENDRIASQDEILSFLTSIVRGEVREQFAIGVGMGAQQLEYKEISPKDRVKAAELLGKRYSLWVDKQQIDANLGIQIVDDIDD